MYISPIDLIYYDLERKFEDNVFKAIQKCNIVVDRDELIKALKYDREQYEKGYSDAMLSIVRCKDCKWREDEQPGMVYCPATVGGWVDDDWFCKGGARIETD